MADTDSELAAVRHVLTAWTPRISEQIAQLYRELHRHPELSMQEHRTAAAVVAALEPLGLDVTAGVGGTGVVAVLRNGDGPVVMLRADMDALPVAEATGPAVREHRCIRRCGRQHCRRCACVRA